LGEHGLSEPVRWPSTRSLVRGLCVAAILVITLLTRLHYLSVGSLNLDEGTYWLSLRAMQAGHPLYSSVYCSQPPAFLLLTEPGWALLGGSIAAARTVMVGWALVGVASGAVIGWRLAGPAAGISIAAILAVDPMMVQQSVILQADGPATALGLLAVAMATCALKDHRERAREVFAFLAGAVLVVGVLTKLLDAAVVPVVAVTLIGTRPWRRIWLLALIGGCVAGAVLLIPYLPAWSALWVQVVGMHLPDSSTVGAGISLSFLGAWAHLELPEIILAALGVLLGWRNHPRLVTTGLVWIGGALVAVAATHPALQHYQIAISPGLALLGGAALAQAAEWCGAGAHARWTEAALVAVLVTVAAIVLVGSLGNVQQLEVKPNPVQVASIRQLIPHGRQLFSDDQFNEALAGRQGAPYLIDTSLLRLHNSGLTPAALESRISGDPALCGVLFATNRLTTVQGFQEWVGTHFPDRADLPGGAVMYRRAGCA
jgi:4-amino-4-deoxy-L-arabinose transferase-like glycosyltransferase